MPLADGKPQEPRDSLGAALFGFTRQSNGGWLGAVCLSEKAGKEIIGGEHDVRTAESEHRKLEK
jgi:hypothetical protein